MQACRVVEGANKGIRPSDTTTECRDDRLRRRPTDTTTVAVFGSRFEDASTPKPNLATREKMADPEDRVRQQAPWDPEPAAPHTHEDHLRSLAKSLKRNGCLSMATAERWVNRWSSIAGIFEKNLTGASGLLLETVDDLVRDLTPGGTAWGCHGTAHGTSPSVVDASSSDVGSQVYDPAGRCIGACLSWYVCFGKTRGGTEAFVPCCRVHDSQPLNLALKN